MLPKLYVRQQLVRPRLPATTATRFVTIPEGRLRNIAWSRSQYGLIYRWGPLWKHHPFKERS